MNLSGEKKLTLKLEKVWDALNNTDILQKTIPGCLDIKNLSKDIANYEPINALDGGIDGLDIIKKVIYKSNKVIKKGGLLAIEIGNKQYLKVSNILAKEGFKEISKEYDYNSNVRCIISTKVGFF